MKRTFHAPGIGNVVYQPDVFRPTMGWIPLTAREALSILGTQAFQEQFNYRERPPALYVAEAVAYYPKQGQAILVRREESPILKRPTDYAKPDEFYLTKEEASRILGLANLNLENGGIKARHAVLDLNGRTNPESYDQVISWLFGPVSCSHIDVIGLNNENLRSLPHRPFARPITVGPSHIGLGVGGYFGAVPGTLYHSEQVAPALVA